MSHKAKKKLVRSLGILKKLNHECNFSSSGQIIKFHQPGFPFQKATPFGVLLVV